MSSVIAPASSPQPSSSAAPSAGSRDLRATLEAMYAEAVKKADKDRDWYARKSPTKKRLSEILRVIPIVVATVAAVLPVISNWQGLGDLEKPSIALFIVAGGFFLADQTLGYSSAWMRFIKAELEIETALRLLILDWEAQRAAWPAAGPTDQNAAAAIKILRDFTEKARTIVGKETELWIAEFQSSLGELQKYLQDRNGGKPPGA